MLEIELTPNTNRNLIEQISDKVSGNLTSSWSEDTLIINNEFAIGSMRFINFDWGVSVLDVDIKCHQDIVLKIKALPNYNPLRFLYVLKGRLTHRFGVDNKESSLEQYHSLIFSNKTGGYNYLHFTKNTAVTINLIEITRKDFLKKKSTNVATLNTQLHTVFVDTDYNYRFANYSTLNLKVADIINAIKKTKGKGMLRILKIEAKVYEILWLHLQQHQRLLEGHKQTCSLTKKELKRVKKIGEQIVTKPAANYNLKATYKLVGLTPSKLQEGFKFLYNRTVNEYVRHIRLETAKDLLKKTDLNVSEVVYSVGFSNRSYFSKKFKEKYNVTPNIFKKQG